MLAFTWIGVIAAPTVPVTAGDADNAGVDVTSGTALGLIRIVTDAVLPAPAALVAVSVTAKSPLCVGVPTSCPDPFTDRPGGRPVPP